MVTIELETREKPRLKYLMLPPMQPIIASRGVLKKKRFGRRKMRACATAAVGALCIPLAAITSGIADSFTAFSLTMLPSAIFLGSAIYFWFVEGPAAWTDLVVPLRPNKSVKKADLYKLHISRCA